MQHHSVLPGTACELLTAVLVVPVSVTPAHFAMSVAVDSVAVLKAVLPVIARTTT